MAPQSKSPQMMTVMMMAVAMMMSVMKVMGKDQLLLLFPDGEVKYPLLSNVPVTNFSCAGHSAGYYADPQAGCQVYHMCDTLGKQYSYLCPNYTLFSQENMVCDYWHHVTCSSSLTPPQPSVPTLDSAGPQGLPLGTPVVFNDLGVDDPKGLSSSTIPPSLNPTKFTRHGDTQGRSVLSPSSRKTSPIGSSAPLFPSSTAPISPVPGSFPKVTNPLVPSTFSSSTPPISSSSPSPLPFTSPITPSVSRASHPPPSGSRFNFSAAISSSSSFSPINSSPSNPTLPSSFISRPLGAPPSVPLVDTSNPFSVARGGGSDVISPRKVPTVSRSFSTFWFTTLPGKAPIAVTSATGTTTGTTRATDGRASTTTSRTTNTASRAGITAGVGSTDGKAATTSDRVGTIAGRAGSRAGRTSTTVNRDGTIAGRIGAAVRLPGTVTAASVSSTSGAGVDLFSTSLKTPAVGEPGTTSTPVSTPTDLLGDVASTSFSISRDRGQRRYQPSQSNTLRNQGHLLRPSQSPSPQTVPSPSSLKFSPVPKGRGQLETRKLKSSIFSSRSRGRGPDRSLPKAQNETSLSFKPNRDFFIPTANFPMPPLEDEEEVFVQQDLNAQKTHLPVLASDSKVGSHHEHHNHDHGHNHSLTFHMTMVFPITMGAQRFTAYRINPKCPHCHPAFLKLDQCTPCVMIK